jgi:hypothetical protein
LCDMRFGVVWVANITNIASPGYSAARWLSETAGRNALLVYPKTSSGFSGVTTSHGHV